MRSKRAQIPVIHAAIQRGFNRTEYALCPASGGYCENCHNPVQVINGQYHCYNCGHQSQG